MNFTKEELHVIYGALRAKQNTLDKLQKWADTNGMEVMSNAAIQQRRIVAELLTKLRNRE